MIKTLLVMVREICFLIMKAERKLYQIYLYIFYIQGVLGNSHYTEKMMTSDSQVIKNKSTLRHKLKMNEEQPKCTEPENITYPYQYIFRNVWSVNLFYLWNDHWETIWLGLASATANLYLLMKTDIPKNATHLTCYFLPDTTVTFPGNLLISFSVTTAAIICDLKILQDWRSWCLITSQNFLIQFGNEWLWTTSLIFAWHSDLWTQFSGEMYFQFPYPLLPTSSNHPFSLFPKNSLVFPFTIISKEENYYYYSFLKWDTWKLFLKFYIMLF